MQSYENVAAGIKRYIASDLLPVMNPGTQIAVGIGARYILANPDRMIEAVMAQFPVLGMLGVVDREKRTIDIEGLMPAAIDQAKCVLAEMALDGIPEGNGGRISVEVADDLKQPVVTLSIVLVVDYSTEDAVGDPLPTTGSHDIQ